jgi:hypothetical protein
MAHTATHVAAEQEQAQQCQQQQQQQQQQQHHHQHHQQHHQHQHRHHQPRESYVSSVSPIDGSASDPFLSESRFSSPNALSTRSTADLTVRQCTRNQAAFNIFLYMFGATQIPYALGQMGWTWGSVFMVAMSISSYHSGHLLADICVRRRAYSWPAIGLLGYGAAAPSNPNRPRRPTLTGRAVQPEPEPEPEPGL